MNEILAEVSTPEMLTRSSTSKNDMLLHALFTESPDGILISDENGRYLEVNASAMAIFGYNRREILQLNVRDLVDKRHQSCLEKDIANARAGQSYTAERLFLRKDGTSFPGEVTVYPLPDGRLLAILRDISARRQAEDALKLFRSLVDRSNDAFEVLDPETARFLDVNERGCTTLGYTREELLSRRIFDVAPMVQEFNWPRILQKIRQKKTMRVEGLHRRKDGVTFPIDINLRIVQLDREYIVAVVRDATEHKQAEQSLRESEERFRQLAENITEVFWITDLESGKIHYLSPAYEKIWGRSCASLCAAPDTWNDSTHPEDRQRVKEAFDSAASRQSFDETYRITRPDGSMRWVRDRGFPIRDNTGKVYRLVGIAEDITENRRLEEQLRQSQKMEAIGTLAGGIAHDFNNILSAINGYTDLAKMSLPNNHHAIEFLDTVLQASERAVDLVRQILMFSRRQEQIRQPLPLRNLIKESLKLLRATIPTTVEFNAQLDENTPNVQADSTQIHQVLMNLGTNAWHAMRDQPGVLSVKLENFEADAETARLRLNLAPGRYVRLIISDTGRGMNQKTLARIFEPFYTTKAPGEGSGLGLAVVHGIMQSHEGAITVYSEPGKGTSFHLYFPANGGETTAAQAAHAPIPVGEGRRVLCLDDEERLARLNQKTMEALGYRAESFTSPTVALAAIRAEPRRFDLIITDQTMPGMTGVEFSRQVLQLRPDFPIILATGYSPGLTPERVREMGICEFLIKPHNVLSLGQAAHRALAQKAC